MEETPRKKETHHFCLAAAGCHLDNVPVPGFLKSTRSKYSGTIVPEEIILVLDLCNLVEEDNGLNRLTLGEVIPELC